VFDGLRSSLAKDRSRSTKTCRNVLWRQSAGCERLAGNSRPVLAVEHAGRSLRTSTTAQGIFRERLCRDLKKFDVPTLVMHGEDDQIVPQRLIEESAKLIKGVKEIYYPGRPHGLTATTPR